MIIQKKKKKIQIKKIFKQVKKVILITEINNKNYENYKIIQLFIIIFKKKR